MSESLDEMEVLQTHTALPVRMVEAWTAEWEERESRGAETVEELLKDGGRLGAHYGGLHGTRPPPRRIRDSNCSTLMEGLNVMQKRHSAFGTSCSRA